MKLDRVYYCVDGHGFLHETHAWLISSIRSVKANTDLAVVVLYSGEDSWHVNMLEKEGAEVRKVRSRLQGVIEEKRAHLNLPARTEGALLRYEIPFLDDAEYSLYVDCDTFFRRQPVFPDTGVDVVGAVVTPNGSGEMNHVNSGVLLFNNQAYRQISSEFFAFVQQTLGNWLPASVDEMAFNIFFGARITKLEAEFNWRPMFGDCRNSSIVHFHGIKVSDTLNVLSGDYRGHSKDFFASKYGHEVAAHTARGLLNALACLKDMSDAGLFSGTVLERLVLLMIQRSEPNKLVTDLLLAHSGLAHVRNCGLNLLRQTAFEWKRLNFRVVVPNPQIDEIKFVINSELAMGRIQFGAAGEAGNESTRPRILNNSGIHMEVQQNDGVSVAEWCSAGIDCHFLFHWPKGGEAPIAFEFGVLTPQTFDHQVFISRKGELSLLKPEEVSVR